MQAEGARNVVPEPQHIERFCEQQGNQKRRRNPGAGQHQLSRGKPGERANHKRGKVDGDIRIKQLHGIDAGAKEALETVMPARMMVVRELSERAASR